MLQGAGWWVGSSCCTIQLYISSVTANASAHGICRKLHTMFRHVHGFRYGNPCDTQGTSTKHPFTHAMVVAYGRVPICFCLFPHARFKNRACEPQNCTYSC